MGKKLMLAVTLLLSLLAVQVQTARATTFLRLESSYLGDGWFQYHVTAMKDPFFSDSIIYGVYFRFSNQIDQASSSSLHWINTNDVSYTGWNCDETYPRPPYDVTFLNRSSWPAYHLVTVSNFPCIVTMGVTYLDSMFGGALSVVGYAGIPCLLPCPLEEADGSPTNFTSDLKLIPDISLDRLIGTNDHIYGVDFNWYTNSTFVLQGTSNFNDWTNIAYIWSTPPETIWTTNQPLDSYGQFYRLAIVAYYPETNLPPLTSNVAQKTAAMVKSAPSLPRVTSCVPIKEKMQVNIVVDRDGCWTVQALTADRKVVLEKNVEVKGKTGSVSFDVAKLPVPVFFQVVAP